jgi:hypothetical protein
VGDLSKLSCVLLGHKPNQPELLDVIPESGDAVVASQCVRCGEEFFAVVDREGLARENEGDGPWDTQPCLFCRRPTMRHQSHVPEMWPCSAVCAGCAEKWEEL